MANRLDQIRTWAEDPSKIPTSGSYGEGLIGNGYQALKDLKGLVQKGRITLTEYSELADPIARKVAGYGNAVASSGSGAASAVTAAGFQQFLSDGYAINQNGQWTMRLPFTKQEYAKLPESALPTQEDINSGMFDPTMAPLQRVRTSPAPQPNPGPGGGNQTGPTPTNQTGNSPVFTANPNNPPPYGGLESNNQQANIDAQKIAQEAALQQQLAVQAAQERASQRQKYLNDLTGVLQSEQDRAFNTNAPDIMEQLNSRGLLQSSELGNAFAREKSRLSGITTDALAKYGIEGQTADLTDLKSIQDMYNTGRNSALQRQFSVEDYNRQIEAGKQMGEMYAKLTPNQGKGGSPTTAALIGGTSQIGASTLGYLGSKAGKGA